MTKVMVELSMSLDGYVTGPVAAKISSRSAIARSSKLRTRHPVMLEDPRRAWAYKH